MFNQAIADLETVGGLLYDMLHVDLKTCIYTYIYICFLYIRMYMGAFQEGIVRKKDQCDI